MTPNNQTISCVEAKNKGLTRYFTGKPCLKGHVAERKTSNHGCVVCLNERRNHYHNVNKEKEKQVNKIWYDNNVQHVVSRVRKWEKDNAERHQQNKKRWQRDNPEIFKIHRMLRKRLIGGQSLAKAFSKEIKEVYKNRPEGCDVDHIIPIRNPSVCGLHVPWNLQYLEKLPNNTKNNKFDFDDESQFLDNRPPRWYEA